MDRSLPACRTFCSRFVRDVMYSTVDKLAEAVLRFASDVGPEDPRRDTLYQHRDYAKTQIPKYQCYPDDGPNRGDGPELDDSGAGQRIVPRPISKGSRPSEGGKGEGQGKKTSESKQKCVDGATSSGRLQV